VSGKQLQVLVLQGGMQEWVNHWYKMNNGQDLSHKVVEFDTEIWQLSNHCCRVEGQRGGHRLVHSMDAVWSKSGQKELTLALEDALHDRLHRIHSGHRLMYDAGQDET
jgi:hypothetical protein